LKLLSDINVSVSPVYDFTEMFTDPHFKHRGITVQVDHPKLGKISMLNTPFKFSGTPAVVENSPPLWGEHTREVLSTVLCYNDRDIDKLIQEDVVQ
jgi:formyl-CoA transferase